MSNDYTLRIESWLKEIAKISEEFHTHFFSLSPEQMNFKPNPRVWSAAQVIDHLNAVSRSYEPTFDALKAGEYKTPFLAKVGFIPKMFGKLILKSVEPDRAKKIKTLGIWEPTLSDFGPAIIDDFQNKEKILSEFVQQSTQWLEQNTIIASPANRNVVYPLETAFDILLTHQRRHLNQAKEVVELKKD